MHIGFNLVRYRYYHYVKGVIDRI